MNQRLCDRRVREEERFVGLPSRRICIVAWSMDEYRQCHCSNPQNRVDAREPSSIGSDHPAADRCLNDRPRVTTTVLPFAPTWRALEGYLDQQYQRVEIAVLDIDRDVLRAQHTARQVDVGWENRQWRLSLVTADEKDDNR